jgi:hypothetical protein
MLLLFFRPGVLQLTLPLLGPPGRKDMLKSSKSIVEWLRPVDAKSKSIDFPVKKKKNRHVGACFPFIFIAFP